MIRKYTIEKLAQVLGQALDDAYHYGIVSDEESFGWRANLKGAEYISQLIEMDITDIEKLADAAHRGWNVVARQFVFDPYVFSDTQKLVESGKLEAKINQRKKLMTIEYSDLPEEEKEKDRVAARAVLKMFM